MCFFLILAFVLMFKTRSQLLAEKKKELTFQLYCQNIGIISFHVNEKNPRK